MFAFLYFLLCKLQGCIEPVLEDWEVHTEVRKILLIALVTQKHTGQTHGTFATQPEQVFSYSLDRGNSTSLKAHFIVYFMKTSGIIKN